MTAASLAIAAGIFGAVFCGGYLLMCLLDRYQTDLDARLQQFDKQTAKSKIIGAGADSRGQSRTVSKWQAVVGPLLFDSHSNRKRLQARLIQAGIYSTPALSTFFAARLAMMLIPPLAGFLAGKSGAIDPRLGLLWGCIVGVSGAILPSFWLDSRIRRRHCVFQRSLPDFLDLTIVCLESGLSLQATIQRVSDELMLAHPVLAGELNIVQRHVELGAPVDVALRRFADRSGYDGVRMLSTFIRESQRFGTEIVEALRSHADMIRSQREQRAEEIAQKASVKILMPTLLLILPAVFVVLAGPAAIQIQQAFSK